ncbi:MAG: low temperature requirement protein A, partial [Acidimicrobiia bacterium]|nr:low temperature requirement protein A [Acidimicrobiia bacterium]
VGDPARTWVWVAAMAFEVIAALRAGSGTWTINAEHFSERHALIIIIALGESIVAVGSSVAGEPPSFEIATVLLVALAGTALLWWAYFDWLGDHWEHGLRMTPHGDRGRYARDVYSLLHYAMISGIVLYAVAAEEMVAHPDEALSTGGRVALALGLGLYLLGQVAATYRSSGRLLWDRLSVTAVLAAFILVAGALLAGWLIGVSIVVLATALANEQRSNRGRVAPVG